MHAILILSSIRNTINTARFTSTTLAPAGVEYIYEITIPMQKQTTDNIPEDIITLLKLLKSLIDDSAGKIMRLDISIAPIICIPSTIVIAVSIAIIELKNDTLTPVALAKLSSNVTANML